MRARYELETCLEIHSHLSCIQSPYLFYKAVSCCFILTMHYHNTQRRCKCFHCVTVNLTVTMQSDNNPLVQETCVCVNWHLGKQFQLQATWCSMWINNADLNDIDMSKHRAHKMKERGKNNKGNTQGSLVSLQPTPALPPFLGDHPASRQCPPDRLHISGQLLWAHGPLACCGPTSWCSCHLPSRVVFCINLTVFGAK